MGLTAINGTGNHTTFALSHTKSSAGSASKSGSAASSGQGSAGSADTPTAAGSSSTSGSATTATAAGSASASGNAAAGAGMAAQYFDKKDLNKDGVVSAAEEMEYDLTHPGETGSVSTGYTQQGKAESKAGEAGNALDIYA